MGPLLPLLGLAAIAALAMGGSKDAPAPGTPGAGPVPPGGVKPIPPGGPVPGNLWDANLSAAEVAAIQTALASEHDPNKLDAMAKTMLPDHPIAAAALSSQAISLRLQQFVPAPIAPHDLPQVTPSLPPPAPMPLPPMPLPPIPPQFIPAPPAPAVIPASVLTNGTPAIVTTHETGIAGRLNVRSGPGTSFPAVGTFEHGESVTVTGPPIAGFCPVTNGHVTGFASAEYLSSLSGAPMGAAPASPFVTPAIAPSGPALSTATITTHDTGVAGRLNVRATPNGTIIGQVDHGATVVLTGPVTSGFYPISGHDPNGAPISGFASAQYVSPNPMPSSVSAGFVPSASANEGDLFQVATQRGDLGLRAAPNAQAPYIAKAARGAQFAAAGAAQNGFIPLRDDGGKTAWAFLGSLRKIGTPVTAGAATDDVGAGPSLPFAELHESALELKIKLATHSCRSYNEPLVKRFQAAAKASRLYAGNVDGWYGPTTRDALAALLGEAPPECFAERGGPKNAQEYWSPMGV